MTPDEAKDNLWLAGWTSAPSGVTSEDVLEMIDLQVVKDKELLLNAAIGIVDFHYLEDTVQHHGLLWLNKIAMTRPTVVLHL
jgi:neurofibromin 1